MFKAKAIAAALLVMGLAAPAAHARGPQSSASQSDHAQEPWRKEFSDVCSKTQDAMTFSQQELTELIRRCDVLLPQIQKLDETRKKVYSERLRVCRGVYAYVLDAKKDDAKKPGGKDPDGKEPDRKENEKK
jgi:hypothetical protein